MPGHSHQGQGHNPAGCDTTGLGWKEALPCAFPGINLGSDGTWMQFSHSYQQPLDWQD